MQHALVPTTQPQHVILRTPKRRRAGHEQARLGATQVSSSPRARVRLGDGRAAAGGGSSGSRSSLLGRGGGGGGSSSHTAAQWCNVESTGKNTNGAENAGVHTIDAIAEERTANVLNAARTRRTTPGTPTWPMNAFQTLMCKTSNVALAVLLVLMVVSAGVLVEEVQSEREAQRRAHVREGFDRAMAAYGRTLQKYLTGVASDFRVWATYVQHVRTLPTFRQLYEQMDTPVTSMLWVQRIPHADREAVQREIHDEVSAFFNSSRVSTNVTELQLDSAGRIVGVRPSPPKPEYFVIRYITPSVNDVLALRDMNSEPVRAHVINASLARNGLAVSTRLFTSGPNNPLRVTYLASVPVYDFDNSSKLLGVFMGGLYWGDVVVDALAQDSAQPARVRVFDVTGDQVDQAGCWFSLLFDGRMDGQTGAWTQLSQDDVVTSPCYASRDEVEALARDTAVVRQLEVGGRVLLAFFENHSELDADISVATGLVAAAVTLGLLSLVLVVGVVVRVMKLIRELLVARQDAREEALHAAEAEQEARKALVQRNQFIAFMSHELRTPIFSIIGTLEEIDGDEPAVSAVRAAAEQMVATLNGVLHMQNVSDGAYQVVEAPINVDSVVKGTCSDEAPEAEVKRIELEYKWDERLPRIMYGDAQMIASIMHHLITNAIEFTEPGGRVTVSATRQCLGMCADLRLARMSENKIGNGMLIPADEVPDGVTLRLSVLDTGIGIASTRLHEIFEPFSCERLASSTRKHGHTELGLPTVKALVTRLGGLVDVVSELGHGSRFTVLLFMPTAPQQPRTSRSNSPNPRTSRLSVSLPGQTSSTAMDSEQARLAQVRKALAGRQALVVEDDDTNRRVICRMLRRVLPACELVEASDGAEAVELILGADAFDKSHSTSRSHSASASEQRHKHGRFGVIFCDILLPSLQGTQVAATVRGHRVRTPIFALSGAGLDEEERAYRAAGINDLLRKPFSRDDLENLLARHWELFT